MLESEEYARSIGLAPSGAQLEALAAFEDLLRNRAVRLGLVAARDAPRLRERHLLDCLRAALTVEEGDGHAYDLGSGAGLPGIVLAIACPGLHVTLVESRRRRVAFLELAVRDLGLANAEVDGRRAEVLAAEAPGAAPPADLCLARALAPAARCWELASPLLRPGGRLVYFAGRGRGTGRLPEGVRARLVEEGMLARWGPLVIMAR